MLKSMTGFGRSECSDSKRRIIVEVKTVNHRYTDISVKMPRDFIALEERILKLTKKYITRGKVDIFVTYYDIQSQQNLVVFNENLIIEYIESVKKCSEKLGITNDISATSIFNIPDAFTVIKSEVDVEEIWLMLQEACENALLNVVQMRECEGNVILDGLMDILSSISVYFNEIQVRSPSIAVEYKGKLESRIKELCSETSDIVDPARLAMEVALFADKSSIDEEVTRMNSHISHANKILAEDGGVGRKMDFLVQEMNREINTIGSKANDILITSNVIALKSEIEKLREQIQNIE